MERTPRRAFRFVNRLLIGLTAVVVAAAVVFLSSAFFFAQRADYAWSPTVPHPAFTVGHPTIVIDEAHNNGSTAAFWGRYWPLARLLRADGYSVVRGSERFATESLRPARVLIIANASGAPKPQLFGINVPMATNRNRGGAAFTAEEIAALRGWIMRGGSLLLIADHAPFGDAVAPLASALGVTMHRGFVEVPGERSDPLLFSDLNGRLGEHAIISGDPERRVHRVMTYTGQSLDGPPGSTVLLRLPPNATEEVPTGDRFTEGRAGAAQAIAFELGAGRVVVLGEAAMMTAQVAGRVPFGMNTGDNDNTWFALNVMRWLVR